MTLGGARYAIQRLGLLAIFGAILLGSAGDWHWQRGWLYLAAVALVEIAMLAVLAIKAPAMLEQRGLGHPDVKTFDKVFAGLWLLLALVTPGVVGLDAVRFGWSSMPGWTFYGGLLVLIAAVIFGTWAMIENEYFEQLVRIQHDREHRVVTTGPYRWVRHPGYLAAIVGALAAPAMLGSAWSCIPVGLLSLLFVVRTWLEDRTLQAELEGYTRYAERTPHRLVPGLW
jgi:protein-S-isoprenylcysteine O-methyltransferase Ste14